MTETRSTGKPVFGALCAVSSGAFALLLFSVTTGLVTGNSPGISGSLAVCTIILVLQAIYDLYLFLVERPGPRWLRQVRGTLVLGIAMYAIQSLLKPAAFPAIFAPRFDNVGGLVSLFLAAMVSSTLRNPIRERVQLYEILEGVGSKSLMQVLSDNSPYVRLSYQRAKSIANGSLLLFLCALVVALVAGYTTGINGFPAVCFFLVCLSTLGIIGVSNLYGEEHRFFAFGLVSPPNLQRRKQLWSYVLVGLCAIIAFAASASRSLLGPGALGAFFSWILSIFRHLSPDAERQIHEAFEKITAAQGAASAFPPSPRLQPSPFWPIFFTVLKYMVLVAAISGLVFFIIRPLLRKNLRLGESLLLFFRQVYSLLAAPFRRFADSMRRIIAYFRRPKKQKIFVSAGVSPAEYLKTLGGRAGGGNRASRGGQKSLELYFRFLELLYGLGLRWSVAETPRDLREKCLEFLGAEPVKQEEDRPVHAERLRRAGELMTGINNLVETDLFSANSISGSSLSELESMIVEIESLLRV